MSSWRRRSLWYEWCFWSCSILKGSTWLPSRRMKSIVWSAAWWSRLTHKLNHRIWLRSSVNLCLFRTGSFEILSYSVSIIECQFIWLKYDSLEFDQWYSLHQIDLEAIHLAWVLDNRSCLQVSELQSQTAESFHLRVEQFCWMVSVKVVRTVQATTQCFYIGVL